MRIREATSADLPAITGIYAHHVLHGAGTFEEVPPDEADMAGRMKKVLAGRGNVWLVAEGDAGEILAYAYYSAFRERSAYRYTVENSIYVRDDVRGQGVGKALVAELIARAEAAGFRQMLAIIGDSENVGSIGLHVSLGFKHIGTMRAVGMKFGRWVDVVTMQLSLGEGDKTMPAD